MATWQPLSGPYEVDYGFVVEPVGSSEALAKIGYDLHNGLQVAQGRDHWAALCADGKRQILQVTDKESGEMVACSELKVVNGQAEIMFVRAQGNTEMSAGTQSFDAVAKFVAAVNRREPGLVLNVEPKGNGFAAPAPVAEVTAAPVLSAWERAKDMASRFLGMSPFHALVHPSAPVVETVNVTGGREPVLPQDAEEWTPVTARFERDGVSIEPVSSTAGLQAIGTEMENILFVPEYAHMVANACNEGRAQVAAIYTEDRGIIGYAELQVRDGLLTVTNARGYAEQPLPADVQEVLTAYVEQVNSNLFATKVELRDSGFATAGFDIDGYGSPGAPVMPQATRHGGGFGHNSGDDGEHYEGPTYGQGYRDGDDDLGDDLDEEDTEEADDSLDGTWGAISTAFTAYNGIMVEPVSNKNDLEAVAEATGHDHMNRSADETIGECETGSIQVVQLVDENNDILGAVDLIVRDGQVRPLFDPKMTDLNALAAVNDYCAAINNRDPRVTMLGSVGEHGFSVPSNLANAARNSQLGDYSGRDYGDENPTPGA